MRKVFGTVAFSAIAFGTTAIVALAGGALPAGAAPEARPARTAARALPKPCSLVTGADVTAALTKLGADLTPTTVGTPAPSKPTNQGGFGLQTCVTSFQLPNSVGGSVNVTALKTDASSGCPPKGQPGKKAKLGKTKALLEPLPSTPTAVRDIAFPKGKFCVTIAIFLSGGGTKVPAGGFVDLAKAALAAKG